MASPEPRLRVVVLCGGSPRHLYVANAICEAAEVLAIVQETGSELTPATLLRKLRPAALGRKLWRWLRDRRRYLGNREAGFFFGDAPPRLLREDLVHRAPHINHPDVLALCQRLQPDLVAVFGTSLLRGAMLEQGRLGVVNLHGGLSPEYRGADCTFWALLNGEPGKVGCTLHYIDAGIDSGRLIAHVCPEIRAEDDELTLFWRGVRDSARVYAEFLGRLARGERFGVAQGSRGRLYQVRQRGLAEERSLARRLAEGMLARAAQPARVHWFEAREEALRAAG